MSSNLSNKDFIKKNPPQKISVQNSLTFLTFTTKCKSEIYLEQFSLLLTVINKSDVKVLLLKNYKEVYLPNSTKVQITNN